MEGTYTYIGTTDKGNVSDKFWKLRKVAGGYEACWGKVHNRGPEIGRQGRVQGKKVYSYGEASKKVNEKLAKGYELRVA